MPQNNIHILLVEDSKTDAAIIIKNLASCSSAFRISHASTLGEAKEILDLNTPDLALVDIFLPDGKGTELLPGEENTGNCPIIIMTGSGDEQTAVDALHAGALDYIPKNRETLKNMPYIVERALRTWEHIVERRRAEEALHESEVRFRSVFTMASAGMAIIGADHRISHANQALCDFCGFSEEELTGLTVEDITHPDDRERTMGYYNELLNGMRVSAHIEKRFLRRDGQSVWGQVSVAPLLINDEPKSYCIGLVQDITARKKAEDALRQSEERFRSIFESSPAAIIVISPYGTILYANPSTIRTFGYSEDELTGLSINYLTHQDDREKSLRRFKELLTGKRNVAYYEKRYVTKEGATLWGIASLCCVRDKKGSPLYLVAQMFNITERKRAEEGLQRANGDLRAFTSTVSHDLRASLASLVSIPPLLVKRGRDLFGDDDLKMLELMEKKGKRMQKIMDDLLTLAKVGTIRRPAAPVNAEEIVREIVQDLSVAISHAGISVRIENLPEIQVSSTYLEQIFGNLIKNALKYAGSDGGPIEIGGSREGSRFLFYVCDHGPGIPEEEWDRIFHPFYRSGEQSKNEGVGIGLAIVKKIAELCNGRVWVTETDGGGSTFWVELLDNNLNDNDAVANFEESDAKYRPLFTQSAEAILLLADGKYFECNEQACRLFGCERQEIIGRSPVELSSPFQSDGSSSVRKAGEIIKAAIMGKTALFTWRHRRPDGVVLDTEVSLKSVIYQGQQVLQATIRDISEQQLLLDTVRRSEEQYRTIFETTGTATIIIEEDTTISLANDQFVQLSGYSREEIEGRMSWTTFVSAGDLERLKGYHRARRKDPTSAPLHYEFDFITRSGELRNIFNNINMIPGSDKSIMSCQDITEIRVAEQRLRTLQRQQKAILDNIPDLVWLKDTKGRFVTVNAVFLKTCDVSMDMIYGKTTSDFWPHDLAQKYCADDQTVMQLRRQLCTEDQIELPSGERVWIETYKMPVIDEHGKVIGATGIARNIDQRRRSENALRTSEAEKELILNSTFDLIIYHDTDMKILWSNRRAAEVAGSDSELIGPYCWEALHHSSEPCRGCPVMLAMETGEFQENEIVTGDGKVWYVRGNPVKDAYGRVTGVVEFCQDITQHKIAEEELRERMRQAALAADVGVALTSGENLPVMLQQCAEAVVTHLDAAFARIWTLDSKGNMLELQASAGMYTHLDGSHARIPVGAFKIGRIIQERRPHLTNSVIGDPSVHDQVWALREGMVAFAGHPLVVADQAVGVLALFSRKPLKEITTNALAAIANKIALGIVRKQMEEQVQATQVRLIHANKMSSLALLVTGIAHEINNPNSLVKGNAAILEKIWHEMPPILADHEADYGKLTLAGFSLDKLEETVPRLLKGLEDGARRVSAIVENLKGFTREDMSTPFRPFDVNTVIRDTALILSSFIQRHTENFRLVLVDDLPPALGKVQQVEQIVISLIMNALQALPDKTAGVTVSARLNRASAMIEVVVRDEGQGMSKEVMEHATELFFSTRLEQGGSGLGLCISKMIITEHSGELHFDSAPGNGTTAMFTLPTATENGKLATGLSAKELQ